MVRIVRQPDVTILAVDNQLALRVQLWTAHKLRDDATRECCDGHGVFVDTLLG